MPQETVMVENVIQVLAAGASPAQPADAAPDTAIPVMRHRIDEIDAAIMRLWQERASISRTIGAIRLASGGTRVVLSREQQVIQRFRQVLGEDGTTIALMLLRAGRGPL
jgi:chorismate mutase